MEIATFYNSCTEDIKEYDKFLNLELLIVNND